jgi:CubicO group peptidase (beta-lactamase class C family)
VDQVFRIASVTKMLTAAMVVKLAELGRPSLDDSLAKYLPDFPNAGHIVSREGFQQMITPVPELPGASSSHRYGMGMYNWQVRGNEMVGHTGQINGFASAVGYFPK